MERDQIDYIMPYVESRYNVSKEAKGRAYAGLSMGGSTTSNMLIRHRNCLIITGSGAMQTPKAPMAALRESQRKQCEIRLSALSTKPHIMLAAGSWDFVGSGQDIWRKSDPAGF